jgi:hypothetical protein
MKKNIMLLLIILSSVTGCVAKLDYRINDGKFFTSEGEIPTGCFGQLITELNGDNSVATVFINRPSLRGCTTANYPYPGGDEAKVSYLINEALYDNQYKLTVCQEIEGSMRSSCDKILVKFVNREYFVKDDLKNVLALDKLGEW